MNTEATIAVRVARKVEEALGIQSFELVSASDKALPAFTAGSHIDVHLPNGLVRQYSLCNHPSETHRYLLGVLRDPASRGGSQAMHDLVNEGDVLRIGAPKNHFALEPGARRSLLLAGGIGITPLLCMAEQLASQGAAFEMHYCTRERERTAFFDRLAGSGLASSVQFHFDAGAPEQKLNIAALLSHPEAGCHLYVCGPKGFINAVLDQAKLSGWPEAQLHCEFFAGEEVKTEAGDTPFQVKLASSGLLVNVPVGTTVVKALADAGMEVMTSCEQGVCGTCLTRVLEGQVDHRDQYLTPEEQAVNDQFLPCCSRARSPLLVLEL
ncbi:Vanillate O-demethylase oxidoreductase [Hydrogenophaga crassostreae]|uniref:Oxidoreductase n=1 Tax=Hydrogenophaga crassostreae TaxID=1763535 RepID=A0A167IST0_9BURK|nr:PDR/VanB family oxidoreductase [Hydrogenophaga crassostreae]AOW14438.1 oxidoreductase [Hydrogenophaga crassostreae]OAD43539.1 Vanillate O-demethylase oxidoreductase [Hydrogenophaga crassostreae]